MARKVFKVCGAADTETTTIGRGADARAFACLYQANDLRNIDPAAYVVDRDDDISFYRTSVEFIAWLQDLIDYGKRMQFIPIVCFYNFGFDFQTIRAKLREMYEETCTAQSSTHVYVLDLYDKDDDSTPLLRFWDTFFLEPNGLEAMGKTAGVAKAVGDWDYSLVRTPDTPLTEEERFYAARDVQVIPAYLRYLCDSNDWLTSDMFGNRVMTKTSIVRQMAKHTIANHKVKLHTGARASLGKLFENLCIWEMPTDYATYAIRVAAFRGGLTFTAALTASQVVRHVISLDVTSMHHTYINGRKIPRKFHKASDIELSNAFAAIINTPLSEVLDYYACPFIYAIHAAVEFKNLRLKKGSAFEEWGIAILPEGKFQSKNTAEEDEDLSEERGNAAQISADEDVRLHGYHDRAKGATFALGKLYSAKSAVVFVTEVELWNIAQVYDFDSCEPIAGEVTDSFIVPPDYVTLQSQMLFKLKNEAKHINNTYIAGEPYTEPMSANVPEGIQDQLRAGTATNDFVEAWYSKNVKGSFNAIYGTQAMNLFRADFEVAEDSTIHVGEAVKESTFADKLASIEHPRVLYTYGMRIVAGSRQHLVIAMMLIYKALGDRVRITGGDTDSMKISCDMDVTPEMLLDALEPLHTAARKAIKTVTYRTHRDYPELASDLDKVGTFDVEYADKKTKEYFYDYHFEAWNKARVSLVAGHAHITCAGLSRPDNEYHIENFIDDLIAAGHTFEEIAPLVLGYGTQIDPRICHALQRTQPHPFAAVDFDVTDYAGETQRVTAPEAIALYPVWRVLGDTSKFTNLATVQYLKKTYGREIDDGTKFVTFNKDGKPCIILENEDITVE